MCFLNTGGTRFANVSAATGLDFIEDARGLAVCDWDLDGKLDLWYRNRTGPQVRFMRNQMPDDNNFLAVRLEGRTCNRDAIGARVELYSKEEGGRPLIKTLRASDGFLSQSSKWVHFGLGKIREIDRLVVRWPGGQPQEFSGLKVNRRYQLVQGAIAPRAWEPPQRNVQLAAKELPIETTRANGRTPLYNRAPLPGLTYIDPTGSTVSLNEQIDRPLLINLWATWCQPCLAELREFSQRQADLSAAGVDVLALVVDEACQTTEGPPGDPEEMLANIGYPFRRGAATEELLSKLDLVHRVLFDVWAPLPVPTSVLVDGDGWIVAVYRGPVSVDQLLADVASIPGTMIQVRQQSLPFRGRLLTGADAGWLGYFQEMFFDFEFFDDARLYERARRAAEQLSSEAGGLNDVEYRELAAATRAQQHLEGLRQQADDFRDQMEFAKAEAVYREGLRLDPGNVEFRSWLGAMLVIQERLDEGIAELREAIRQRPNYGPPHGHLGVALAALGRTDEAIREYRTAIELSPGWWLVQKHLAWLLATHPDARYRNGTEAVALAEEMCQATRYADPRPLDVLAAAHAETGNFDAAVRFATLAIEACRTGEYHDLQREIEGRLEGYQQGRPFRASF